jgi:muramidase (phage lysozyme)
MFGKLFQTIFLPKRTRDKLAAHPQPLAKSLTGARNTSGQPQVAAGRDQLLNEALTVYRAQMKTYEALDEETRRQIEEDAAKAFGAAMVQRKS